MIFLHSYHFKLYSRLIHSEESSLEFVTITARNEQTKEIATQTNQLETPYNKKTN